MRNGMRNPRIRAGTALLVVVLLLGVNDAVATVTNNVKIVDFAFKPKTISVPKGTRVKWVNKGSVSHTSTSNSGLWNSGAIAPGDTFSHVFKKAGTFKYHCTIHPSTMVGKIIVG
jgi:plastocyanin